MSFSALLTQTITVVRTGAASPTIDTEGNSGSTPATLTYPGLIQQRDATELQIGPDTFISNHQLFLEPDALIEGRDQVTEGSRRFEVIGVPDVVRTPRGDHHLEVNLRQVFS